MTVLLACISIIWCAALADKQGRSWGWAVLFGLLFGIFAIIGYYIAGDKH